MLERTPPADILQLVEDDYEGAPWLVMADSQGWAVNHFASTLDTYALRQRPPWYIATLLPVYYWSEGANARKVVSPDTFMARVTRRHRESYDVELEGKPPAFVLEVVSPDSVRRDTEEKLAIYEEMGVREYALFGPLVGPADEVLWMDEQERKGVLRARRRRGRRRWPIDPPLQGWRRDESSGATGGRMVRWQADPTGRLWSAELGLWLAVRGDEVGLQLANGVWLRTHDEAEAELERLRQEVERLRGDSADRKE